MHSRNPINVNVVNGPTTSFNPNDTVSGFSGIPINMTTLPEKMRAGGYIPHAIGKWHAGMYSHRQTPLGRGYESWLGYYGACNSYWTMVDMCGMAACGSTAMVDFWEQDASRGLDKPGNEYNNSQLCSQQQQSVNGTRCVFEDDILAAMVRQVITNHSVQHPDQVRSSSKQ